MMHSRVDRSRKVILVYAVWRSVAGSFRDAVTVSTDASPDVSVIIPTLALPERATLLWRAIESVGSSRTFSAVRW